MPFDKIFIYNYQLVMDCSQKMSQHKKLYQTALSTSALGQERQEAIMSILKMAIFDHSHFSFLLNQINWFCSSYKNHLPLLGKIIRIYRGTSRSASRVAYNLLAQGLSIFESHIQVVDIVANSMENTQYHAIAIQCIKNNYPHKVCQVELHQAYVDSLLMLCRRIPAIRFELMEIIIENLASFDTEMELGQDYTEEFISQDDKILALAKDCGEFENKYDRILNKVLEFIKSFSIENQEILLKEMFIIFEKVIMIVDNTKMVQFIMFYLAEVSIKNCSTFLTLLFTTISENYTAEGSTRKLASGLQYLSSYIQRSLTVKQKQVKKIILILMTQLKERIEGEPSITFSELDITHFFESNIQSLLMLQAILQILSDYSALKEKILPEYLQVIELGKNKLHFSLFLNPEILQFHGIEMTHKSKKTIKCVNKFIPVFLPLMGQAIEMKIKITGKRGRPFNQANLPERIPQKKMMSSGSNTPLTIGEYQL